MKYLLLLLLTNCSIQRPSNYQCLILGENGILVKIDGFYSSEIVAKNTSEKIRLSFVEKGVISENSWTICND